MIRKILTLLFTAFLAVQSNASHIAGGEIYWDCIGPNQYEITLVLYRDCSGINVALNETIDFSSPCGNQTLQVTHSGPTEISQLCANELANSTCNGGTQPGYQQFVYTGIVTLAPCDFWTMGWDNCCRNPAIANLVNPDTQDMYIQATLNSEDNPCDNSPRFTNAPIPYVCLNTPITYSYGAFDVNGDSISYALISAMEAGGNPLAYVNPYTPAVPLTGLTLDPQTGLVTFTLTQGGAWVVVVEATVWNTDVSPPQVIGRIMRDMQFIGVPNCTNDPPDPATGTISNFSGSAIQTGPYSVELCETDNFCMDMVINDVNVANTLTAISNVTQNLPGATFSYTGTNPITATVCWTAAPGTSGFFPFIITVNDDACPITGFNTYVYAVNVLERTSAGPDQVICGDQVAQLGAQGGSLFTWSVLSGEPIQVGVNFTCNPCSNPIADPSITTTYIVESDLSGTCINADTVTVSVVPDFTFTVSQNSPLLCLGESLQITTTVTPNVPGYQYEWTPSTYLNDPFSANPIANITTPGTYNYLLEITSPDGCIKLDTNVAVTISPGYVPQITVTQADEFICEGETTQFFVELDCTLPDFCGLYDGPCCGPVTNVDVGTDVQTGTTTSYPAPFGHFYEGARHQILYKASELQALGFAGGKISELGFEVSAQNGTSQYFEWEVKIGCTTLEDFSTPQWLTGLTSVFYADTFNITTGWNMFQLPVSFNWDGVSNLVIETCFSNNDYLPTWTQNSPTFYTVTGYPSVIWRNQDNNSLICSQDPGFINSSANRPNLRVFYCGGVDLASLEFTWTPPGDFDDPTSQNPFVTPTSSPATYSVVVGETGSGCTTEADVTVNWIPPPNVSFIPEPNEGVVPFNPFFNNTSDGNVITFTWDFGDGTGGNEYEPNHLYEVPGTYIVTLTGITDEGCVGFWVDTVIVLDQPIVEIPNVFSPNGDGENDTFAFLDFRGFKSFSFKVFNRWGMLLYEGKSLKDGNNTVWKPTSDTPDGTYFYVFNGTGVNGDEVERSGNITLLR